jgi:6,7-dimethyl-8-ribityllumazine synthase
MGLDEKALARMAKEHASKPGEPQARSPTKITDTTAEFEEYESAPRLDEQGRPIQRPKGLRAAGYEFPPPAPAETQPLTKANLAKGVGVPGFKSPVHKRQGSEDLPPPSGATRGISAPVSPAAPPASRPVPADSTPPPPSPPAGPVVKVDEGPMFEEYQRPDLREHPKTGRGLRTDPPPGKSAKDILKEWPADEVQVLTPKRFPPGTRSSGQEAFDAQEEDRASLDAASDIAMAYLGPELTMSESKAYGPVTTVISHTAPLAPPPVPAAAPDIEATPHHSGSPPVTAGGDVPRIALVQADFHFTITTRMANAALEKARQLGAPVIAHAHVPGAFDLPLAVKRLLGRGDVDAVVCVGAILQGETMHDEVIANACAQALTGLALATGKPVGFGVTGPGMTLAQAEARIPAGAFAVESVITQHRALKRAG